MVPPPALAVAPALLLQSAGVSLSARRSELPAAREAALDAWLETGPEARLDHGLDAALSASMERFRVSRHAQDFEDLYRQGRALVLAWVVQALGRQRGALDPFELVQDTFVNIFRYAAGFRYEDALSFRRWARTIAGNVVRKAGRVRASALAASSLDHEASREPADPCPGPGALLEGAERERELRRAYTLLLLQYAAAYATLSPRDREALRLVEVEGLAYREVAARLAVGLSNTKMIVFRARQRLRARLEQGLVGQRAA